VEDMQQRRGKEREMSRRLLESDELLLLLRV
jgi:hypothetical protein